MKIVPASDSSLLVLFGQSISAESQAQVLTLFRRLLSLQDSRIRNLHPAYASLLIDFDPLAAGIDELPSMVEQLARRETGLAASIGEAINIPVCYEAEFAPDLGDVAAHNNISVADVVRIHSATTYDVCFLGFTAGFAYLGGLPKGLHTPRLATPRRMVAAGSVGIAGGQTGVYPAETPGGWRLIGRTPLLMFDPQADPPARLQPGARVKFSIIDREEFDRLRQEPR